MRVLIVDDDEASRLLIASILRSADIETDEAADGVEALEKGRVSPPDLLISDVLMPRMDGYQLVREWKADPVLSAVPAIVCTASYTDPEDERFARDLGVDGFLDKPVEPQALLELIDGLTSSQNRMPRAPVLVDETEVLRGYSQRIVRKLEDKVVELERANTKREGAMAALNEEVRVKQRLLEELKVEVAERTARESELRRERDLTGRIIDTADVFVVGLDGDLRVTLFNSGAERKSGVPAAEALGMSFPDAFVPDEDRLFAIQYVRAVQGGDEPPGRIGPIRSRGGERRVFEWTATTQSDTHDPSTGVLMFGVDVTDRVTTAIVDRAMARIDLAVLLDRPRSEILDVACERLVSEFGYALALVVLREESGSLEIQSLTGPLADQISGSVDGIAVEVCPVREAMEQDTVTIRPVRELSIPGADERLDDAEVAAVPLRAHGVTMGAIGLVSVDREGFTAHRRESLRRLANRVAVALLVVEAREQVAMQSAALESAGNAIVIATDSGRVTWVNRAFTALTGHEVFEAVGAELFGEAGGYHEPLYRDVWDVARTGRLWRGEFTNTRRDGTSYLEDVTFAPVLDDEGVVRHVVIVKNDISERQELEQLKSEFVAIVSHELRTPLTSIIGYADIVARACAGADAQVPDGVASAMSAVQVNATRMRALIERLLEVVQVRSDLLALAIEDADVGAVLRSAIDRTPATGLHTLQLKVSDDVPLVRCDVSRMTRVFELLLDNAFKYSPDGGEVRVTAGTAGSAVTVSIEDHGVGMPPDRIPGLFADFTQLDMSSTRRFGGMGLGLFLAYNIVRAHGGNIIATSEEGRGSTFTVHLPAAAATRDAD